MFLEKIIQTRLTERDLERIKRCIERKKDQFDGPKYQSESHFMRCAALRLLKEEGF